jgi:hypothetical protein
MSSRAVLHVEGMYFSGCKNETKSFRDEIWWLEFELIGLSKFSSLYYFWHLSYSSISALLFFKQSDIVRIASKNKIEVPHGENLKKVVSTVSSLKSVKSYFDNFHCEIIKYNFHG